MKFYLVFLLLLGLIYLSELSEAKAQNLEHRFQKRFLSGLLFQPTRIGPPPIVSEITITPVLLNQMPISKLYKSVGIRKMMKND
ncbi:hypothetical protein M8J75_001906 [Diaphorina citri]|nr:hypothetical protein M8J75_001906 [Diaphorina citri]